MRIVVLSRNPRGYTVKRFRQAARDRKHELRVCDTLAFSIMVEHNRPAMRYNQRPLGQVDAVIPRIGPSISAYGAAVTRQFEQMGMFCLNSSAAIGISRDKLRTLQVLSRHDIGIPASAFVRRKEDVLPAIERVGGAPVIIKLLEGVHGVGVILADSVKIAEAIIETLHSARISVLVQKFVAESRGRDVRAVVIDGRVVAAMRRVAAGQEFRSNVHRGGRTERVELTEPFERAAVKATQVLGLRFAGVDILEGETGPQVMEVNSSPGLEGIEQATGVDIAGAVIDHLEEQNRFPDIDLRQRLSLKSGYGVVELPVQRRSTLAGKTIGDTGLRDREVLVLNIQRGSTVIPAPRGDEKVLAGDTLLCFGKLPVLRSLLPRRRKRAPRVEG